MMEEYNINKIISNIIESKVDVIANKIIGFAKRGKGKVLVDFKMAFSSYLDNSYQKNSKIKTILYRTEPKYIYDFFVPNKLKFCGDIYDSIDTSRVLEISKFLVIQGTGGIGKTTLLKHFFVDSIRRNLFIPLFFELRDLNDADGDITTCMYESFKKLGFDLSYEMFLRALKNGEFLILLDGFDEINMEKNKNVLKKIENFSDQYRENYFIMSSRPNNSFISLQKFSIVDACMFSKEQSLELISKIEYDDKIKERFIDELENNLYETHQSFASNPLLLNIMLLTYDNYAEIPSKLHIFYANAFETLYNKHDATKGGYKRNMKSKLSYSSFKRIFSEFCFITYIKSKYEFTDDELEETINEIRLKSKIEFETTSFKEDLIENVCLIYKDGYKNFFTHRSFQEYFTALYIKDLDDELQKKVAMHMINSRVNPFSEDKVFSMLCDMNSVRYERNVILPILNLNYSSSHDQP